MVDVVELQRMPMFRTASRTALTEALAAFMPCEVGPGELLMREGEADRSMFLVLDGELSVHVGEDMTELARIGPGEILGEMALFGGIDRRAATVCTCTHCRIVILDAQGLHFLRMKRSPLVRVLEDEAMATLGRRLRATQERIGKLAQGTHLESAPTVGLLGRLSSVFGGGSLAPSTPKPDPLKVLQSCAAFRDQDLGVLTSLARRFQVEPFGKGQRVFEETEVGGDAYILAQGVVDLYRATVSGKHERIARLREGRMFGAASLVDDGARAATAVAAEPSWLLRLPRYLLQRPDALEPAEANGFRRAVIDALAGQLRLANGHVETLERRAMAEEGLSEDTEESYRKAASAVEVWDVTNPGVPIKPGPIFKR